jgi:hypothetical protein
VWFRDVCRLAFSVVLLVALCACSESESGDQPALPMAPGQLLVLGSEQLVTVSGSYLLPSGTYALTIECQGTVTYSFNTAGSTTVGHAATAASGPRDPPSRCEAQERRTSRSVREARPESHFAEFPRGAAWRWLRGGSGGGRLCALAGGPLARSPCLRLALLWRFAGRRSSRSKPEGRPLLPADEAARLQPGVDSAVELGSL